jgi:hypothetical protein
VLVYRHGFLANAVNAALQLKLIKPGDSFQMLLCSEAPTVP